jgi:hypothetical protein
MTWIVVRGAVLTALLCVGLTLPVWAQGSLGAIAGVVMDSSGAALPGVTVTLTSPGVIGGSQTTISDGEGAYRFERLVAGRYGVKAELQGFQTVVQDNLVVNADRTSRADLKLAVGELAETITVSGQAPVLDTRSALQQTPLTRQVLDTVPTGYDTWSIVRLAPSIAVAKYDVGGRSMFGQSGVSSYGSNEREYFVDGMDVNQYGGTFYIDSFAFEEVNIQTSNLTAERSTGGVVWNFVTKTGSNGFHGAASFLGMTHDLEGDNISPALRTQLLAGVPAYALAANPNPRLGESIEHMFDLAGSFSGPIIKDRLWYSGALKLGEVYTRRVGSYNEDGTQLLSDNQLRQSTAKISFAATPNNQLHYVHSWVHKGRYTVAGGPTVTEFFSRDAAIYNPARHWLHIGRWTSVLSQRAVLDVAGSLAYGNNHLQPEPGVEAGAVARFDVATRINTVANRRYQFQFGNRANIHYSLNYTAGDHDLKVGHSLIYSAVETWFYHTSHYPSGLLAQYRNGAPESVRTYNSPAPSTPTIRTNGVYVQDRWTPAKKLTLNVGLRFETAYGWINDGKSELCQPANPFIAGQCFPAVKGVPDFKGLAPRLAAVYDLFGNGRTALKFSANRYLERITSSYPGRVNPINTSSDTRQWTDRNGDKVPQLDELGASTGFNLGTTNRYADDVEWPIVNEISAEFQQELGRQLVFGSGYHYRAYRKNQGARNLLVPTESYTAINVTEAISGRPVTVYNQNPATLGLFDVVWDNSSELNQTYKGMDVTLQKRMSNGWMAMGSVVFGTNDGYIYDFGTDLNNPNLTFRQGIASATDVPVFVKFSAAYDLPWGIAAAGTAQWYRGWPETTTVRVSSNTVRLTQVNQDLVIEPRGTSRMDDVTLVDLNFRKRFKSGTTTWEPRLDVYNLLNAGTVTDRIQQLGPSYHNVIALLGSRMIKLGANLSW